MVVFSMVTRPEKETTAAEDSSSELPEAILPLMCRTRFKWRSTWSRPNLAAGLVIFLKNASGHPNLHRSTFIKLQEQDFSLQSSTKHGLPWLIDSCNGLLLYAKNDGKIVNNWNYFISSPLLDHFLDLPRRFRPSILVHETLVFDGIHVDQFKVVSCFCQEVDIDKGTIACQIFSSIKWEWKERQAPLLNSHLLQQDGFHFGHCFGKSVHGRSRIYSIWSLCVLIYADEGEFFELVELPTSKANWTRKARDFLSQFLWESEGNLHYCEPTDEGFSVWIYCDDEHWRLKWRIGLHELRSRSEKMGDSEVEKMKLKVGSIRPCAFNEELQVLYCLQVAAGAIVTYSIESGEMAKVWSFGKPGEDYSMCYIFDFLFNSVNLFQCKRDEIECINSLEQDCN